MSNSVFWSADILGLQSWEWLTNDSGQGGWVAGVAGWPGGRVDCCSLWRSPVTTLQIWRAPTQARARTCSTFSENHLTEDWSCGPNTQYCYQLSRFSPLLQFVFIFPMGARAMVHKRQQVMGSDSNFFLFYSRFYWLFYIFYLFSPIFTSLIFK